MYFKLKIKICMTSEALVKAILTEESCELYDKVRIKNLLLNITRGYGKLINFEENISITIIGNKSKKLVYIIPRFLLSSEDLIICNRHL